MLGPQSPLNPDIPDPDQPPPGESQQPPDEVPESEEPEYRAPADPDGGTGGAPMRMPGDSPDVETEL